MNKNTYGIVLFLFNSIQSDIVIDCTSGSEVYFLAIVIYCLW